MTVTSFSCTFGMTIPSKGFFMFHSSMTPRRNIPLAAPTCLMTVPGLIPAAVREWAHSRVSGKVMELTIRS